MAEALGAIASIVSIVGAGAKLSIVLFDFAGNIGSAGSEVRAIGTEITLFCSVLQQLERTLAKAKDRRYSISALETTQRILGQCQFIFEEINGVVGRLQKQKPSSGEISSVDFRARMKWLFKRSQVQQYRATLESCKITLHLMLTTLEFAERVSARRQVPRQMLKLSSCANYGVRLSTVETEVEDEQEELMTQSLAIAQKCAVDRLEKLEDEELEDPDDPEAAAPDLQERTRLIEATPSSRSLLSNYSIDPPERASVWLNELLSLDDGPTEAQRAPPTTDSRRFSQLPHLLWKWTDQGEHWNKLHEEPPSLNGSQEDHHHGPRSESQPEHQHVSSADTDKPASAKIPRRAFVETTPLSPMSPKTDGYFHWTPSLHNGSGPAPPSLTSSSSIPFVTGVTSDIFSLENKIP